MTQSTLRRPFAASSSNCWTTPPLPLLQVVPFQLFQLFPIVAASARRLFTGLVYFTYNFHLAGLRRSLLFLDPRSQHDCPAFVTHPSFALSAAQAPERSQLLDTIQSPCCRPW